MDWKTYYESQLYFLKAGEGPWERVTMYEWMSAERGSGFFAKDGSYRFPATGGFGSSRTGIEGKMADPLYADLEFYTEHDPEFAAVLREALGETE